MHTDSIEALLALLRERHTFVVTSHARPDGDAIGSSLAFAYFLEAMGKEAHVAFADPVPSIHQSLPGADRITRMLPDVAPDALIVLECDSLDRTGFRLADFERLNAPLLINIDHHRSGRAYADFNWIDPEASAVGAMIYETVIAAGVTISPQMATCLYAAVLTDTGSFTYPSTVAATFGLAEHLLQSGAAANSVAQAVYFSHSPGKIRALGAALFKMKIEDSVAWSWITLDEMKTACATIEDCEGVVNYLISIAGVRAAVFFREVPDGEHFRLSLRSKSGVDVARVAEAFGGGGHQNASGCTVDGPLESATHRVVSELHNACTAVI